jgi:hypothetical protein
LHDPQVTWQVTTIPKYRYWLVVHN